MTEHMKAGTKALELARAFGYLFEYEVLALQVLAQTLPEHAMGANVGAGAGTSSLALKESRPDLILYTVDISPSGPEGGLENERNAFKDTGLPLPIQVLGDSKQVGRDWSNGKLDFCWIDAGHLEDDIRGDIAAWRPNMKRDGIMAFHDYESVYWPAVYKVVNKLMSDCTLIFRVDTLIAFRVP
jgi:predicted O-methyltransferase YrrM